mmetsp:Transcript_34660/g.97739  ORF Transcript_34660/g.97739 Transcript_34660/m.97739 type:complete len:237 (+) Transcript_34660:565-1275(+)
MASGFGIPLSTRRFLFPPPLVWTSSPDTDATVPKANEDASTSLYAIACFESSPLGVSSSPLPPPVVISLLLVKNSAALSFPNPPVSCDRCSTCSLSGALVEIRIMSRIEDRGLLGLAVERVREAFRASSPSSGCENPLLCRRRRPAVSSDCMRLTMSVLATACPPDPGTGPASSRRYADATCRMIIRIEQSARLRSRTLLLGFDRSDSSYCVTASRKKSSAERRSPSAMDLIAWHW